MAIENGWDVVMGSTILLFGWIFQEMKDCELSVYLFAKCVNNGVIGRYALRRS